MPNIHISPHRGGRNLRGKGCQHWQKKFSVFMGENTKGCQLVMGKSCDSCKLDNTDACKDCHHFNRYERKEAQA